MQSFNNYNVASINPDGTVNISHNGLIITRVNSSNPSIGNAVGTTDFVLGKQKFNQTNNTRSSTPVSNQESRFRYIATSEDDFEILAIQPSGEDISCVHFEEKLTILLNDEVPSGYTKDNFNVEFSDTDGYLDFGNVVNYISSNNSLVVDTPKFLPSYGNSGAIKVKLSDGQEDDIPFTEYVFTSKRRSYITISFNPDMGLNTSNNYPNPPDNSDPSKYFWDLYTFFWPTEVRISGYKDFVFSFYRVNIPGVLPPYTQSPYQYEIRIYKKTAGGILTQITLPNPIFGNPSGSVSEIPDLIAYGGQYGASNGIGNPLDPSYFAFIDLYSEDALKLKWQVKTFGGFPAFTVSGLTTSGNPFTYGMGTNHYSFASMFMLDTDNVTQNVTSAISDGKNFVPTGVYQGNNVNGFIGQTPFDNLQFSASKQISDIFGWPNDGIFYLGNDGILVGCGKSKKVEDIRNSPDISTKKLLRFVLQFTDTNTAVFIYINDILYAVSGCPYYKNMPTGIESLDIQQAKYIGNKQSLDFSIMDNCIHSDKISIVTDAIDYTTFNKTFTVDVVYKDTGSSVNVKLKAVRYIRFVGVNSSDLGAIPYQSSMGGAVNIAKIISILDKESNLVEPSLQDSFITHSGNLLNGVPVDKISFNY